MPQRAGRRHTYETPEEFEAVIDAYFSQEGVDLNRSGLILYLGFRSEQSYYNQGTRGPEWAELLEWAKLRLQNILEERLSGRFCTGAIFALKSHYGWVEKQAVELTGKDGKALEFTLNFNGNGNES